MAGYCVEADVLALTGVSDYAAGTTPTETEVTTFIDRRAGEIYAVLRSVMGDSAPGTSDYSVTVDTSTDAGITLDRLTKQANALGAAVDALEAGAAGETPQRSERVRELYAMYKDMLKLGEGNAEPGPLVLAARGYLGESTQSANQFTVGEITAATSSTSRQDPGITFKDSTLW